MLDPSIRSDWVQALFRSVREEAIVFLEPFTTKWTLFFLYLPLSICSNSIKFISNNTQDLKVKSSRANQCDVVIYIVTILQQRYFNLKPNTKTRWFTQALYSRQKCKDSCWRVTQLRVSLVLWFIKKCWATRYTEHDPTLNESTTMHK